MALGLRLRVTNTQDGSVLERTFDRFPVRVGRNPLSDLRLNSEYVSQFHAVLDLQDRTLFLTDLGSRNGTVLRNVGRVEPHKPVDLAQSNYEFAISSLVFVASPAEVQPPQSQPLRMRGGSVIISADEANAIRASAFGVVPQLRTELKPYFDAYRRSWTEFFGLLSTRTAALPTEQRAQLLTELAAENPLLAREADFQRLAVFVHANLPESSGGNTASEALSSDQLLALQVVKELAASYVPNRPLDRPKDLVLFVTKLQGVLDVFFKSFIPLRDGYRQFENRLEIRRAQEAPARAVEQAQDPRDLAAALLDWNDATNEGARAIESTFASLMVHQVALLDGVMRGVRSLLQELSPDAISQEAEKKGRAGWFRSEGLWKTYVERHSDFADEDKETFELIFGKQFVKAYSQYAREGVGASGGYAHAGGTVAPPARSSGTPVGTVRPTGSSSVHPPGNYPGPSPGPNPGPSGGAGGSNPPQR